MWEFQFGKVPTHCYQVIYATILLCGSNYCSPHQPDNEVYQSHFHLHLKANIKQRIGKNAPPCCHVIRAQNIFGASQKVCLPGSTFSHLKGCCFCSSLLIQWSESVAIFITRVFVFGSKLTLTSVCRVHRRRVQIFETTSTYSSKFVIRKVHTNSGAVFPKSLKS